MRIGEARREQGRAAGFFAIECKACSAEWPSDPALSSNCPTCDARPGERCFWRGPHGYTFHIARDRLAMREGHLSACDALTWDGRHSRHAVFRCDQATHAPASSPPSYAAAAVPPSHPVQLALL
ncbi:hypothetical protein RQ734_22180 [Roseomonas mucosa]|uniref:hypothetical protein n=1 Tax=Roseomonas mucosa TaxID=207340 RepID=UPI0028CF89AF|nr:hypothetical protein [Roseomonas mucosa]MDT8278768.1 hypothetical protein [Roseomonas mucosa]